MLEQKSIGYVFPGAQLGGEPKNANTEQFYSASSSRQNSEELANYKHSEESPAANKSTADAAAADWKIVVPFTMATSDPVAEAAKHQVHRPKCLSPNVPDEMGGNMNQCQAEGSGVEDSADSVSVDSSPEFVSGILPSARSRLASLKELGVKKIGALKLKLAENRIRTQDKGKEKRNQHLRAGVNNIMIFG